MLSFVRHAHLYILGSFEMPEDADIFKNVTEKQACNFDVTANSTIKVHLNENKHILHQIYMLYQYMGKHVPW